MDYKAVKEEGVVFTPPEIAKFMVGMMEHPSKQNVLEPSCGEGYILQYIPKNNYITGIDINADFVKKCRKLYPYANIIKKDFLDFVPPQNTLYDCIIGNPPYVKIQNMTDSSVEKMQKDYPDLIKGNTNLYVYFILKCMDMLKEDGNLIFLIPNSLFYNTSLRPVLDKLLDGKNIKSVIDFRDKQMFEGFSTYTCIVHLTKKPSNVPYYLYRNGIDGKDKRVPFHKKTKGTSTCPFRARIGLMTLLDDVFVLRDWKYSNDRKTISFYRDNIMHTIERAACKKILKVSKNERHLIIYPYVAKDGTATIDEKFGNKYPMAFAYLNSNKARLNKRDSGDVSDYPAWYAYGRTQSIVPNRRVRLFLSSIIRGNVPIDKQVIVASPELYYAGLWLEPIDRKTSVEQMLEWLRINHDAILQNSNIRSGGWYAITQRSFDV